MFDDIPKSILDSRPITLKEKKIRTVPKIDELNK
jgi:hypothetical protein